MKRTYKVYINVYNVKRKKPYKAVDTIIYNISACTKNIAGEQAMLKAWEEKKLRPKKFKNCIFGLNLNKIETVGG